MKFAAMYSLTGICIIRRPVLNGTDTVVFDGENLHVSAKAYDRLSSDNEDIEEVFKDSILIDLSDVGGSLNGLQVRKVFQ